MAFLSLWCTLGKPLKTYLGRWTIGRSGERGSGISVLPTRYDDDDDDIFEVFALSFLGVWNQMPWGNLRIKLLFKIWGTYSFDDSMNIHIVIKVLHNRSTSSNFLVFHTIGAIIFRTITFSMKCSYLISSWSKVISSVDLSMISAVFKQILEMFFALLKYFFLTGNF